MREGKFLSKWIQGLEGRYTVYYWPKTGHCEVWCFVYRWSGRLSKTPVTLQKARQHKKNCKHGSCLHYDYHLSTGIRKLNRRYGFKYILRSRLLYSHFVAPIPKGYEIHHIDGDQTNDRLENLLCLSHRDHSKLHHQLKKQAKSDAKTP